MPVTCELCGDTFSFSCDGYSRILCQLRPSADDKRSMLPGFRHFVFDRNEFYLDANMRPDSQIRARPVSRAAGDGNHKPVCRNDAASAFANTDDQISLNDYFETIRCRKRCAMKLRCEDDQLIGAARSIHSVDRMSRTARRLNVT